MIENLSASRLEIVSAKNFTENILGSMADVLLVVNREGIITRVNQATLGLTGYTEDELVNQPVTLISGDEEVFPDANFEVLKEKGFINGVEKSMRTKDGGIIPISLSLSVMRNMEGRVFAFTCIAQDVTERKRVEAEHGVISEIIQGVASTANLDELLQLIHQSIGKILYAENCYVALYDAKTDLLSVPFCVDKYDEPAAPAKLGTGLTAYVLRKNQPMLITTEIIHELTEKGDISVIGTDPAVWLGVPLRTPEGIIGVLVVQHYENAEVYDQRDVGFLSSVGDQIALAIERKRAENALRENEEKYRELFENANDIIYTLDLSGSFTSLNRAGEHITGYSRAEAVQMSIADVIAPKDIANVRDRIAQNIKGAELSNFELEIIAKDERKVTMDISSRLIRQNGVPVGIQGIGRDITERKQAEKKLRESEEWMKTIFDGSRDGIIIEDKGAIVYANKSFAKLFGYDESEEVIGKLDTDFLRVDEAARLTEFGRRRLLDEDAPSVYEFQGRRKDKMLVEMEAAVSTSVVGGKKYIMTAIRDITERLEARHELERFNEKLQQSNRELQDFAYVASHDLQEPLRKVQAFSDRLKTKYADRLEGEGLDYLERMRSAANRMQLLIQDLLTFSRVSTKVQPFISVDLNAVTQEVLSDLEVKIEESGATIELKDLPTIDADPMQMRQLIQNLVGNALKFRRKDTAPYISICAGSVKSNGNGASGNIQISVQDNGIGFDEKYTDKIFAVFQRLHGRTEYEGSGVGLAICRKIVERHNGKIVAHSIPGGGSTFVVTIPIRQSVGELN